MAKIALKTGQRDTSVPREVIRKAVTDNAATNSQDVSDEQVVVVVNNTDEPGLKLKKQEASQKGKTIKKLSKIKKSNVGFEIIRGKGKQVKINSFVIDLAEIERAILSIKGIEQTYAAIVEHRDGSRSDIHLVAYYTSDIKDMNESEIREILSFKLPEYMIPQFLIKVDSFPLAKTGRVNMRALPLPMLSVHDKNRDEPSNEIETGLCKIWQDVLELDKVGVNDSFFSLGGNSILAIRVAQMIMIKLKVPLKISDLFRLHTIKELSEHIIQQNAKLNEALVKFESAH